MKIAYVSRFGFGGGREILSGVLRFARQRRDWRIFPFDTGEQNFRAELMKRLDAGGLDGYLGEAAGFDAIRHNLAKRHVALPHVIIDSPCDDAPFCLPDNALYGKAAAEHLIRHGYRTLAYAECRNSKSDAIHSRQRRDGFLLKARQCGVPAMVISEDFADQIVRMPLPVGVMAYNDQLAMRIVDDCLSAKMHLPEQVGVVGVDDEVSICESMFPSITSIRPDFSQAGFAIAKALDTLLHRGRRPKINTYGIERVVQRDSTRNLHSHGKLVSDTLNILHREYAQNLTLDALSTRLNVSKNLLMLRFREQNGQSIHTELLNIRLTKANEVLTTTSNTVKETAILCGFNSVENFQRAFKRRFGITPSIVRSCGRTARGTVFIQQPS